MIPGAVQELDDIEGVLAPIRNADLIGQEKAEQNFLDAYNSGCCPHAWLLSGPKGVGKATLAYRIARFLLLHGNSDAGDEGPDHFGDALAATAPVSQTANMDNPICQRIQAGGHVDFMCLRRILHEETKIPRRNITVQQVRAISNLMTKTAGEGGWRVVVIDAADILSPGAANAVLKMLEEPPRRTILLLISNNPGRLLPTIHSRCRHLTLPPLAPDVMETLMTKHAPELGAEERALLLQLAGGSIGRALTLVDEGGTDLYRDMLAILDSLPNIDIGLLHKLGDHVARDQAGDRFRTLAELIDWSLLNRIKGGVPGSLEGWFGVWEKANRLFRETEGLSLDRKQVVLEVFLSIEDAARG